METFAYRSNMDVVSSGFFLHDQCRTESFFTNKKNVKKWDKRPDRPIARKLEEGAKERYPKSIHTDRKRTPLHSENAPMEIPGIYTMIVVFPAKFVSGSTAFGSERCNFKNCKYFENSEGFQN